MAPVESESSTSKRPTASEMSRPEKFKRFASFLAEQHLFFFKLLLNTIIINNIVFKKKL